MKNYIIYFLYRNIEYIRIYFHRLLIRIKISNREHIIGIYYPGKICTKIIYLNNYEIELLKFTLNKEVNK